MSLYLTNEALRDLEKIAIYTKKTWGEKQYSMYLLKIRKGFNIIDKNYLIGTDCSYIKTGYRKYPVEKHIIFYRMQNKNIEIVRILHSSMDIENQL